MQLSPPLPMCRNNTQPLEKKGVTLCYSERYFLTMPNKSRTQISLNLWPEVNLARVYRFESIFFPVFLSLPKSEKTATVKNIWDANQDIISKAWDILSIQGR